MFKLPVAKLRIYWQLRCPWIEQTYQSLHNVVMFETKQVCYEEDWIGVFGDGNFILCGLFWTQVNLQNGDDH